MKKWLNTNTEDTLTCFAPIALERPGEEQFGYVRVKQ